MARSRYGTTAGRNVPLLGDSRRARDHPLRKVGKPDEVISFGSFDGTKVELEALRPSAEAEEARAAAMAPFVESEFADGLYEVVEVLGG